MSSTGSLPFSLLRQRDFAWYFWGTFISMFGMGIHMLGVNWYLLETTGSETNVSLIMMTSLGAGLLVLPLSGSIIDRHSRKAMVILPDLIRGLAVAIVATSIVTGGFHIWMLWPMAFVLGCNHAFYFPASMALLQEVLPAGDYLKANALRELTFQVGSVAAAGIAGWVIATYGLEGVLFFDGATYLVSAFCISRVRYKPDKVRLHETREPYLQTVRGGLQYLMREKPIFIFGIIQLMPFVTVMALNVLTPTFVRNILHRGPVVFGLVDMVYGIGAFLAASFIVHLTRGVHERASLAWMLFAAAVFYFLFGITTVLIGAFALMLLLGFANSGFRVIAQTYLMKVIPPTYMGRANSTFFAISLIAQLSTIFAVGWLAEQVSIAGGFWLLAALLLGALLHFWRLRVRLPEGAIDESPALETGSG